MAGYLATEGKGPSIYYLALDPPPPRGGCAADHLFLTDPHHFAVKIA